jgi:thiol-disulfide isomerase/thioredoxin
MSSAGSGKYRLVGVVMSGSSLRQRRDRKNPDDADDALLDDAISSNSDGSRNWLMLIVLLILANILLGYVHLQKRSSRSSVRHEEASLVKSLSDDTLPSHIAGHPNGTLVNFHVENCVHCQKLAPEFEIAAKELSNICDTSLVSVDASLAPLALKRYGVTRFPAMLWFRRGELLREVEPRVRTSARILEFVDQSLQSAVIDFASRADFDEAVPQLRSVLQGESPPVVVGFGREPAVYEALSQAGEKLRGATAFLFVKEGHAEDPYIRVYFRDADADQTYTGSLGLQDVQKWLQPLMDQKGWKRTSV